MKRLILIVIFILSTSHVLALKIAVWNVHNYLIDGRLINGKFMPYYPKPEYEKSAIRIGLHKINADIIVFTEIGDIHFVKELQADLAAEGLAYPHALCSEGEDPRQIGMLSKIGPKKTESLILKDPLSEIVTKRPLFVAEFNHEGKSFCLCGLHLKGRMPASKKQAGDLFNDRREAEARAVGKWLQHKLIESPNLILAGDFNDGPTSAPVEMLTQSNFKWYPTRDEKGENWTYCNKKTAELRIFDGFMLSSGFQKTYPSISAKIIIDGIKWASDHRALELICN
jgi:endonuclease/exonuclease/phosphatase family metal-dependent hydrolase